MAEALVLFVFQQMMIGQYRYTGVNLAVQLTDITQAIANINLIPGVVEPIFQLADNRVAQVLFQYSKHIAGVIRIGIDVDRLLRDQVLVSQRFIQLPQIVFHLA
ncbi:hypothetical protein D3C75_858770 [compost metagenome]